MKLFTMHNTSITLLVASIAMGVFAFSGLGNHDATAQDTTPSKAITPARSLPPIAEGGNLLTETKTTNAPAVETVILPIQQPGGITPERVENLVLKWIMVLTSIMTAIASLITLVWSKIAEIRRTITAAEINTAGRLDRQEKRVEATREKAEALEVKVERHLTICDPTKNPAAHGGTPSSAPQPAPAPPAVPPAPVNVETTTQPPKG